MPRARGKKWRVPNGRSKIVDKRLRFFLRLGESLGALASGARCTDLLIFHDTRVDL